MNDVLLREVKIANDNLLDKVCGFSLGQPLFDELAQIWFAQLSNDVSVIFGGVDFVKAEDVRKAFEFLEHLDLTLEQYFVNLIFEQTQVNDFDCHILAGLILAASVDLAWVAFADDIVETIAVALYFLSREIACHALCSWLKNNNI